jgi:cytochrome c oxidase subunit 2
MNSEQTRLQIIAVTIAVVLMATVGTYGIAQPAEQVIKITAKKFDYTPSGITLKKGVPVILELTTSDILMGFNLPDLGIRTDIIPGQLARVRLVPQKTGSFPFHCDIFCGIGHEDMQGIITVTD